VLSLESLQIRRNHNSLKSLSFVFSPALRASRRRIVPSASGDQFTCRRAALIVDLGRRGASIKRDSTAMVAVTWDQKAQKVRLTLSAHWVNAWLIVSDVTRGWDDELAAGAPLRQSREVA
jgi:hypothetical protein